MTLESPSTLPHSIVDPHNPVPLYHQIYLDLRQMTQNGIIPPGGILPPEMEICQAYSVGRQTIRKAIARLVGDVHARERMGAASAVQARQYLWSRQGEELNRRMLQVLEASSPAMKTGGIDPECLAST